MDYSKIEFKSYIPIYDKYFELLDESITNWVSFSKYDSKLIFYDSDFVGFYKTMLRDDDLPDREIYIGIIEKYRGKGIANYVLNTLCNNIFESDNACEFIYLSIDKDNEASINMAKKAGFKRNKDLEEELIKNGDNRTLVFSLKNKFLEEEKNKEL